MTALDFLKGVYNITPTPFHPDGSLDPKSIRTLTEFTIARGVHGMTILGVLGEADKLTARAVVWAPPRLARANDAALLRHYTTVADAISIPVVVQDHPTSSGVLMEV